MIKHIAVLMCNEFNNTCAIICFTSIQNNYTDS